MSELKHSPRRSTLPLCPSDQEAALLDAIRQGNYHITACRLVGIDWDDFQDWFARGEAQQAGPLREFRDAVLRAEAEAESDVVKSLRAAGERDWRAHASWLGRRHRERWSEQSPHAERGPGQVTISVGIALPGTGGGSVVAEVAPVWTTVPELPDPDR